MFCIKIAEIPIGIENRYLFLEGLCREYKTDEKPLFVVSATEDEILSEQDGNINYGKGYCESLCIYRKICLKLPEYNAFLMHSAVIAVEDAAYVFAAPSGTGKTTHIRLWSELFGEKAQVVNGDKPVFRYFGNTLYACGTPWQGKEGLGSNILRPVQAVCFLEQNPENRIRHLRPNEISPYIFRQMLLPKEKEAFECFWNILEKFISSTDFYLMQCNCQKEAAILAYQFMSRKEN